MSVPGQTETAPEFALPPEIGVQYLRLAFLRRCKRGGRPDVIGPTCMLDGGKGRAKAIIRYLTLRGEAG